MKYICHLEGRASAVSHSAQEAARIAVAGGFAVDVWHDGRRLRVQPGDSRTATVQRLADARAKLYAGGGRPPRRTASGPGYRLAASARVPIVEAPDNPPPWPVDHRFAEIHAPATRATVAFAPTATVPRSPSTSSPAAATATTSRSASPTARATSSTSTTNAAPSGARCLRRAPAARHPTGRTPAKAPPSRRAKECGCRRAATVRHTRDGNRSPAMTEVGRTSAVRARRAPKSHCERPATVRAGHGRREPALLILAHARGRARQGDRCAAASLSVGGL